MCFHEGGKLRLAQRGLWPSVLGVHVGQGFLQPVLSEWERTLGAVFFQPSVIYPCLLVCTQGKKV